MAVSLPRLQKIETSDALPKNDRINMQVKDQASSIMNQTSAVTGIADKVGDIYQKYENDKIDQLSNDAEQEYTNWNKAELGRLSKSITGDPTDAYVEYDKQAAKKREDILAARPDLNDRVKRHFTSRLDKTVENQNEASMYQRGQQQEVYANKNYEASLKLKKDNLPTLTTSIAINPNKEESYSKYQEGIDDIRTTISRRGLSTGTVRLAEKDEGYTHKYTELSDDGKTLKEVRVVMTDLAKSRVAKEVSEGVKNSVEVLLADGKVEAAKELQTKYRKEIDDRSYVQLDKKFKAADRKEEANSILPTLGSMIPKTTREEISKIEDKEVRLLKTQEAELDVIKGISEKNPELGDELLGRKVSIDNRMKTQLKDQQDRNYDFLSKRAEQGISEGKIFGVSDLMDDPATQAVWDKMSKEQRKAVHEMIDSPPTSNPNKLNQVNELIMNGSIVKMSKPEFQLKLNGLSKTDKEKTLLAFDAFGQQSDASQRTANKRVHELLKNTMIQQKVVKYDFNNKMTKGSVEKLNEANEYFMETIMSRGGKLNDVEIQKEVSSYVSRVKQDLKPLAPEGRQIPNVFNTPKPSANVTNTPIVKKGFAVYSDGTIKLRDRSAQQIALNAYKAAGKSVVSSEPASVDAFKEWMKSEYLK